MQIFKYRRSIVIGALTLFSLVTVNAVVRTKPSIPTPPTFQTAPKELRKLQAETDAVKDDLNLILKEAKLENAVTFTREEAPTNFAHIKCTKEKITIDVHGGEAWGQTFYMGLQRLG